MSIASSALNYANTEAEFERILNESLNNCVIPKQDISDILLTKSVYLYVANLLKPIIAHQASGNPGVKSKCISCYTESSHVLNICKCGLENLCYTCILAKYIPKLTDNIKSNKALAVQNITDQANVFEKKYMLSLLQNTIFCNYCKVTGFFHDAVNNLQTVEHNKNNNQYLNQRKQSNFLHETDFLHMETKTLIDIFPNMDLASFINHTNKETITNYGVELEYDGNTHILSFKLNTEFIESIIRQMAPKRMGNIATIQCNVKLITPAIFNAIYYKCIDFSIKNKVLDQKLLFSWNKYCQKMNKLLTEYGHNGDAQMNYYISVVLLNEIKGIPVI